MGFDRCSPLSSLGGPISPLSWRELWLLLWRRVVWELLLVLSSWATMWNGQTVVWGNACRSVQVGSYPLARTTTGSRRRWKYSPPSRHQQPTHFILLGLNTSFVLELIHMLENLHTFFIFRSEFWDSGFYLGQKLFCKKLSKLFWLWFLWELGLLRKKLFWVRIQVEENFPSHRRHMFQPQIIFID